MSKYDHIQTAADLVQEVAIHGLSTEQDDINRAQDIFGRATIGELVALANDIGRQDADGNPDPKGSWSTGRKGTQDTFYFIAFNIWNWRDATRFFVSNSHPLTEKNRDLVTENGRLNKELESLTSSRDFYSDRWIKESTRATEATQENDELKAELQLAEAEITSLKAKLYDLMTAGA